MSSAYALDAEKLTEAAKAEETTLKARIGISVINTQTDQSWNYRGDERFPLNSTFKALACGAMLAKADAKELAPSKIISFNKTHLVTYSPVTEKFVSKGMSLGELCVAATEYSDNTAINLVLEQIGGPEGLTAYLRSIGDTETRLDRLEPDLNEATPGDLRDTTTPNAVVKTLKKLTLGDGLSEASRDLLRQWMVDDKVADALLRSTLPKGWKIADKTGAGEHGSRSIIAVIWPPEKKPLVVGIYITQTEASMQDSNQAIARLGAVLANSLNTP
ncbi:class A beta-lactamase [Hohaiivirga grylli]